jgi:tripartite-type tricarboxylate transporter receptor subunit TctC
MIRNILRSLFRLAFIAVALGVTGVAAADPQWPAKPVRFIVPLAAGGVADTVCRLMAERLSALWGQQVVVENRAGGNAIPGTEAIARAAPDGYTIGLGIITTQAANPYLYEKLPYNVETDFTPIVMIATSPLFLVVHPSVPANNLQEFLAYARANPDRLSFASTGYGSSLHLAAEQLMQRTGIRMVHVPYKGMGNAMQDLLSGQVQVAVDITSMAQVRQGKLKALGVASTKRFEGQPGVPSFAEQGLPDFEAGTWLSVHAPAGIPPAVQRRINEDFNRVLQSPEVRERLMQLNHTAVGGSPESLASFLAAERRKYAAIIRTGGIKVE